MGSDGTAAICRCGCTTGEPSRELGEGDAALLRGVLNSDNTEPLIFPAEVGVAERSRLLLRDLPSVRLLLRRRASDGESGDAIVSRDLNSEQNEDFREPAAPAGDGVRLSRVGRRGGEDAGGSVRPTSSVGRTARSARSPRSPRADSSSVAGLRITSALVSAPTSTIFVRAFSSSSSSS